MLAKIKYFFPPFALCALFTICVSQARAEETIPATADILNDIGKVQAARDVSSRAELAQQMLDDLNRVWGAREMDKLDSRVINGLISLLSDDDDWVRATAAAGVGYFGIRARRAVPALNHALDIFSRERQKEVDNGAIFASGLDSTAFIETALKRVQGTPDAEIFDDPPKQDGN